jgi:hypothetical protein
MLGPMPQIVPASAGITRLFRLVEMIKGIDAVFDEEPRHGGSIVKLAPILDVVHPRHARYRIERLSREH